MSTNGMWQTFLFGSFVVALIFSSAKIASGLSRKERRQLEEEIRQLVASLGRVTAPINTPELRRLYDDADYPRMLGWIKNQMRLDLRVGLRVVDSRDAKNPMWIETPRPMPIYGSREFRQTRVIVNVRKEILDKHPFEFVVAGFAHELSHVVLFSIGHPLQHSERAVDLTSMILGYRNFVIRTDRTIYGNGVRVHSSLGYLTRFEKEYAHAHLARIESAAAS
jgi:hypothetical protein